MDGSQEPKNFGPLIGAIDQGTSSSRFMVFTSSGNLVTFHQVPVVTTNPHQGWAEQDPVQLLASVVECIDATVENLRKLEFDPQDIVAIGKGNCLNFFNEF
jgi:glycerol kinase